MRTFRHPRMALRLYLSSLLVAFSLTAAAQFSGPALPPPASSAQPAPVTTDPNILFPVQHDSPLNPGDLISVRVFGIGDYTASARISNDGTVQLPLIGVVRIGGLSVFQAETLIASKLQQAGVFTNPQVSVGVTEGPESSATVIGEVHNLVPIIGRRRLLDVLSAAGGLPPTASHVITINRPGQPQPIVVDLGTDPGRSALADVPIFAGDTIVVSRVGVVYVIGAFKNAGVVPVVGNSPLTLLQVTALSGGVTGVADFKDMRIIRTTGNQRTLVKLDVKKVLYGKAPDPILQADDIIFLPTSMLKAIIANGGTGTVFGLASILITTLR